MKTFVFLKVQISQSEYRREMSSSEILCGLNIV